MTTELSLLAEEIDKLTDEHIQNKSDEAIELESIHDEDETEGIEEQEKRNKRFLKISCPKQLDLRT